MKMWARRYRDLGDSWTQTVCRLHALLCDLVPGGFARRISMPQAIGLLETMGLLPASVTGGHAA